jgi:DNA-directed RNA polymerase subunit F
MEAKLIGLLGIIIAFVALFGWAEMERAGKNKIQAEFTQYKLTAAQEAATAIAAVNKERDDALTSNEAIALDYQNKLSTVAASATVFAQRLRNAEATIARNTVPKAGSGQPTTATISPSSADQLGKLAQLTADLHAECVANADQLDALIAELKPQL